MNALRRIYSQSHSPGGRRDDREMAAWVDEAISRGRLTVIEIHAAFTSRIQAVARPPTLRVPTGGLNEGPKSIKPPPPRLQELTVNARLMLLLLAAIGKLPAATRATFLQMFSPLALKIMAAVLAGWVAAHAFGAGEAVDVVLLGISYALVGKVAVEGVRKLGKGIKAGLAAKDDTAMNAAADDVAGAIAILGVNSLAILLTHRKLPTTTQSMAVDAVDSEVVSQWSYYIANLKLPFNGFESRAALWSRLGDRGMRAATSATQDGLVTLEMLLRRTDFMERYRAQFGDVQSATTNKVWEMMSERYASHLRGTVVVYTNKVNLIAAGADGIYREPQLGAELFEIMERPHVDRIIFKDVDNPSRSSVLTKEDLRKIREFESSGRSLPGGNN
jgi:hypothetical protein